MLLNFCTIHIQKAFHRPNRHRFVSLIQLIAMWFFKYFQHHPISTTIGIYWIMDLSWQYMTMVLLCRWREVWKHDEAGAHQVGSYCCLKTLLQREKMIWAPSDMAQKMLTPATETRGLPLASWDLQQSPAHCNWHGSQCSQLLESFIGLQSVFWWRPSMASFWITMEPSDLEKPTAWPESLFPAGLPWNHLTKLKSAPCPRVDTSWSAMQTQFQLHFFRRLTLQVTTVSLFIIVFAFILFAFLLIYIVRFFFCLLSWSLVLLALVECLCVSSSLFSFSSWPCLLSCVPGWFWKKSCWMPHLLILGLQACGCLQDPLISSGS